MDMKCSDGLQAVLEAQMDPIISQALISGGGTAIVVWFVWWRVGRIESRIEKLDGELDKHKENRAIHPDTKRVVAVEDRLNRHINGRQN